MRQRIVRLVAATTSAVVVGFLVPLLLLVASLAEDRAATSAKDQAHLVAGLLVSVPDRAAVDRTLATLNETGPHVVVVRAGEDPRALGLPADTVAAVERARSAQAAFTVRADHGLDAVVPVITPTSLDVVIATASQDQVRSGVSLAWAAIIGLGALLVGGAVLMARALGRRVSTPVTQVAAVAHRLREGDLQARAPVDGPAETAELGQALNRLADRIEGLLGAERERVADLGHRLRTPVTALRLDADLVADPALAERLHGHVDHLQRSIDTLVAEARRPVRESLPVDGDLVAIVRERTDFWRPLAEDQGRELIVSGLTGLTGHDDAAAARTVALSTADLTDLVDCLLDNVFAHTPEGTPLHVSVTDGHPGVVLEVADGGSGLAPGLEERGRSGGDSTGLGLDIVRRLTHASGEIGRAHV